MKKKKVIVNEGPLFITHRGILGPAVLRLSAFAAREFHATNYRTQVAVHWAPEVGAAGDIEALLWRMTTLFPKRYVGSACPHVLTSHNSGAGAQQSSPSSAVPQRLWLALVSKAGFAKEMMWCEASKKNVRALSQTIVGFCFDITIKSVFKDEFVTAGDVSLKGINMKRMESKVDNGLFFCGEVSICIHFYFTFYRKRMLKLLPLNHVCRFVTLTKLLMVINS